MFLKSSHINYVMTLSFSTGFYTPLGALVVAGLHALPLVLYVQHTNVLSHISLTVLNIPLLITITVLALGRFISLAVEVCEK